MVKTTENQICSPFYLFKPYLLCVALLVTSTVLISFLGLGFYPMLFTIPILILSTSFLVTFTKKRKLLLVENPASKNLQVEDEVEEKVVMETVSESDAAQKSDIGIVYEHEFQIESSDDSGSSENNLELNWMVSGNVEQNPGISDDSTSEYDEEGLIEIAIPGCSDHSTGLIEEAKEDSNLPTCLPESTFKQPDLVDLLAEMKEVNEEDNLIEIDISMGSIKCPRFEIEA